MGKTGRSQARSRREREVDALERDERLLIRFVDGDGRLFRASDDVRFRVCNEAQDDTAEEVRQAVVCAR